MYGQSEDDERKRLARAWEQVAGEAVAKYSQADRIEARRLVVRVAAPVWASRIRMTAPSLIAKLAEAGFDQLDEIDIKVLASWPP